MNASNFSDSRETLTSTLWRSICGLVDSSFVILCSADSVNTKNAFNTDAYGAKKSATSRHDAPPEGERI
jgi:hypothetical protein